MKKIIFLLLISLCVTGLNGMETADWKGLPIEVKGLIVMALAENSTDLDGAIKNIRRMSAVNNELYNIINNIKSFTVLVHILANKYNSSTRNVAHKFGTPIAKQYIDLGDKFLNLRALQYGPFFVKRATNLIDIGADVNFSSSFLSFGIGLTPLSSAIFSQSVEIVRFLLTLGAYPSDGDLAELKKVMSGVMDKEEKERMMAIKQLIEDARNKRH
jgi:hypothetical protein